MISEIIVFLGWCSVINICVLALSSIFIFSFKGFVTAFHSKISGIDEKELMNVYIQYLGNYKIFILIFNIVPYISLKIMT